MSTLRGFFIPGGDQAWPLQAGEHVECSVARSALNVTGFATGFFFSFRAVLALMTARWINIGSEPGVVLGLSFGYILLVVVAFQAVGSFRYQLHSLLCWPSFRWVLLYLAVSVCSLAWSGTISVQSSFLYWNGMATDVAIVILLIRGHGVPAISHSLMKGFVWSSCLLALIAWAMPVDPEMRLGDLEFFNTNQVGNLCAIGVFFAQFLSSRKDGKWRFSMLLLVITLLRSMSKATIVAFIASQGVLLLRNDSMKPAKKVMVASAFLVALLLFWGLFQAYYDVYSTSGNKAETLTGRTAIWAFTLEAALEKPWTGNGIDAMWKVFPPFGNELFEARHAENELLQQFFSYGVVGVVMLVGLYGSLHRRLRGLQKGTSRTILLCMMLFIVLRGMVEAEPIDLLLPLWMITLFGAIATTIAGSRLDDPSQARAIAALAGGDNKSRSVPL